MVDWGLESGASKVQVQCSFHIVLIIEFKKNKENAKVSSSFHISYFQTKIKKGTMKRKLNLQPLPKINTYKNAAGKSICQTLEPL